MTVLTDRELTRGGRGKPRPYGAGARSRRGAADVIVVAVLTHREIARGGRGKPRPYGAGARSRRGAADGM